MSNPYDTDTPAPRETLGYLLGFVGVALVAIGAWFYAS